MRAKSESLGVVPMASAEFRRPNITGSVHDGDYLMTIEQVAEFLQLPVATIRKQRSMGTFAPGFKLGKHVRWRRSSILEWLEAHADEI
jgi:excisionase family DNA binding protein